jgi:AcrR family transcriptional regulator
MAAARVQFAREGLAGTSADSLIQAAGVTAPTLYHHFEGKTGLFVAVTDEVYGEVIDHLEAAVDGLANFADLVDAILRCSVLIMRTDPSLSAMIAVAQTETRRDPSLAAAVLPIMRRFRQFFDDIARNAPSRLCSDESSRRHLSLALITVITGLNAQASLLHGSEDFEGTVDAMRRLLVSHD